MCAMTKDNSVLIETLMALVSAKKIDLMRANKDGETIFDMALRVAGGANSSTVTTSALPGAVSQ